VVISKSSIVVCFGRIKFVISEENYTCSVNDLVKFNYCFSLSFWVTNSSFGCKFAIIKENYVILWKSVGSFFFVSSNCF